MYRRTVALNGFWSTIFHGSLAAGKVALATAAGGPAAGAATAAGEIGAAVKGSPKAPAAPSGGGAEAASGQPANWLAGMNNTQLAFLALGGAAVVISLGSRR
jgi:hypothetical protein